MGLLSFPSTVFPLWVLAASVLVYCIGGLLLKLVESKIQKAQDLAAANDDSEKGTLHASSQIDPEEEFQLEKRAFLSKVYPPCVMSNPSDNIRLGCSFATQVVSPELVTIKPSILPAFLSSWCLEETKSFELSITSVDTGHIR